MTIKEREYEALNRIKEIVASLGEGSYVEAAFDGAFEIAEENIENDFACSLRDRWEGRCKTAEKKVEEYTKANAALKEQIRRLETGEKERTAEKVRVIDEHARYIDELERRESELKSKLAELEKDYEAARAAAREITEKKDLEILQLKAKLYDMMVK